MHNTMWVGWDDSMLPKTLNLFVEDAPHPSQHLFETIQSNMKSHHNKLFLRSSDFLRLVIFVSVLHRILIRLACYLVKKA